MLPYLNLLKVCLQVTFLLKYPAVCLSGHMIAINFVERKCSNLERNSQFLLLQIHSRIFDDKVTRSSKRENV